MNFKINGEFLTQKIRDFWESKEYRKAIQFGLESLYGAEIEHIISIINGKMKLIGVNDLDLVEDMEYKPNVDFLDILNYSMIPNNGYFKIYDEDEITAKEIINYFNNYSETKNELNELFEKPFELAKKWKSLLPEVQKDNQLNMPHWLLVYLRKSSDNKYVRSKANLYSINIVESELNGELKREIFDDICDKFYIYSDRENVWNECLETRKKITKTLNQPDENFLRENLKNQLNKYKSDATMKSNYGWLSPDGTFIVCDFAEHELLASLLCEYHKYPFTIEQKIGKQLSDVLLKMGYVKIHRDDLGFIHFTNKQKLTLEQETKIGRYKHHHNINKN
ncbi:MAG: hypothetical protein M0R03_20760 [Novosphingobium sp.]|nr:hypothetical protein [Novosphingobium sp.]